MSSFYAHPLPRGHLSYRPLLCPEQGLFYTPSLVLHLLFPLGVSHCILAYIDWPYFF